IVVLGRARVRLAELDFEPPYRRARATVLAPTQDKEIDGVEVLALTTAASAFAQLVKARDPDFRLRLPKDATPGALADACAHHLILSGRERQQALEELDIAKRVQLVTEILTVQRASLTMGNASEVN
ncbi:MAG: LON peptidase substrate-binding domain-containing protein, partial [Myxococcota bacterium]